MPTQGTAECQVETQGREQGQFPLNDKPIQDKLNCCKDGGP